MNTNDTLTVKPKTERLKFIDVARSIAILLMLEGHFIETAFKDFAPMVELVKTTGTSGSRLFDFWYFMKGFTAPMFFTVTGIVFVFLLVAKSEPGFIKNSRVRNGFNRVGKLLFWGYFIQFNIQLFDNYLRGESYSFLVAFHVLQCIGVGIFFLLLTYGLYKLLKVGPLALYYFIVGTVFFGLYPLIKSLPADQYFPLYAPEIIQNLVKGKFSIFPLVPWLGFTLYGGMLGSLIFSYRKQVKTFWFPGIFILVGFVLFSNGWNILHSLDQMVKQLTGQVSSFVQCNFILLRFGQIVVVLGILMYIEKFFTIRNSLFLKIGQNTLPIYIIHVVILYGGIFGVGLSQYMKGQLNGYQAVGGALLFIAFFAVFIKYFEFFEAKWDKAGETIKGFVLNPFTKKNKK